jgi:catechol 2,3-dioxygenase-like lactoylglutathione lyase family enzyme
VTSFKPQKLLVVTLWAEDVPELIHFYRDVIGLELLPEHGKEPAFAVGDGTHLIIKRGKSVITPHSQPFPLIAFEVDNLDKAIAQLKSHQVVLTTEVVSNPTAQYVIFHDPAGNLLEFAELFEGAHS